MMTFNFSLQILMEKQGSEIPFNNNRNSCLIKNGVTRKLVRLKNISYKCDDNSNLFQVAIVRCNRYV